MSRLKLLSVLFITLLLVPSVIPGRGAERINSAAQSNYLLRTAVMGASGSPSSAAEHHSNGTMGQPMPPGKASAEDKVLYAGFWRVCWQEMVTGEDVPVILQNRLFQNYPNPFNPVTTIEFMVDEESLVEITIFNVKGQKIRCLVSEIKSPGKYGVHWDGMNDRGVPVSTGMYFYRLKISGFSAVKKMLLLR